MQRKTVFLSGLCLLTLMLGASLAWAGDIYVPGDHGTIQEAVNAAVPFDVIHVDADTYTEQVHITTNDISIVGAGVDATVIASPVTLTAYFMTGTNYNYPVVFIDGATGVALSDLTIDGDNQGDTNFRFTGVGFWNGDGSITDAKVLNVMDSTFSGAQHGVGVYSYNDTGGLYSIAMTDVVVDGYQKTAVALLGEGLTVALTRVTTIGEGDTSVTAQNGIQTGYGSGGTVTDCDVIGNSYTGGTWTASGILPSAGTPLSISGTDLDGNQTSLYFLDNSGSFDGGTIVNPKGDAMYAYNTGAMLRAPVDIPAAQPFDADLAIGGNRATLSFTMTNSTVTGADVVDSWGPSAYAVGDVSLTVTGCDVSHWDWGVVAYEAGGAVTSVVNDNSLVDNITYGYFTNATALRAVQDAEANWWGHASGPHHPTANPDGLGDGISDAADYSPWYAAAPGTSPMTYYVDDSIQAAVDAADPGDTIYVEDGVYYESVSVYKALTIAAASSPEVVPGAGSPGFDLSADDITIQGFTIHDCSHGILGWLDTPDYTANYGYSNIRLLGNIIYDTNGSRGFGIYLGTESERYDPADPLGIYDPFLTSLLDFTGLEISGNEIYDTAQASVVLQSMTTGGAPLDVSDNYLHHSTYSGLWIDAAQGLVVEGNVFDYNSNGVFTSNYGDGYYEGTPGTPYDPMDISIVGNTFTNNTGKGVAIYDGTPSGININGNAFSGNVGHGVYNYLASTVDATGNWWGDSTGPFHGSLNPGGLGDNVTDYVDFDPYLTGNIVCVPDPEYLTVADPTKTISVDYLGGGGGLLYGYSLRFTWDAGVASTSDGLVDEGPLLEALGTTFFFPVDISGNEIQVDGALLGDLDGTPGPGTLFTIDFTGVAVGTSGIDITLLEVRDKDNQALTGFTADDGLLIVDVSPPLVVDVEIENLTLLHTNEYIKNFDAARVTATVTDDDPAFGIGNISANLEALGGGATDAPDSWNDLTGEAVWTLTITSVTTTPTNGVVTVTVNASDANGNTANGTDTIIADNEPPTAVLNFDAAPGHKKCDLSWTVGTDNYVLAGTVVQRSDNLGEYPVYSLFVGAWPVVDAFYPGDHLTGTNAYTGGLASATDNVIPRNIYYYQAFCYDEARNYGAAAVTARDLATNYWLGDVAEQLGSWGSDPGHDYNGLVNVNDIDKLAGTYYVEGAGWPDNQCDVGPTVHPDDHRLGLPLPDGWVEFEDLMVFAMNHGVVAPRVIPYLPDLAASSTLGLELVELGFTETGELEVAVRLSGNADEVKGLSAAIAYEGTELECVGARLSEHMSMPVGRLFFWHGTGEDEVQIDLAVLGTGVTIGGSGDVAVLTFRALADVYGLDLESARLRGASNENLTVELSGFESRPEVPAAFRLVQNSPNPFNPKTAIAFDVPREAQVAIRVYDVTGRLVRTLVDGVVEPGRHSIAWEGLSDDGAPVGSGVYFCTMETTEYQKSRKMLLLK